MVRWSGHDCVTISHFWPNDVSPRACPKRLRQRGLHHPCRSPQGLHQLLRHCGNPRTRVREDFNLSSRGRTGNRKTPRDMLHQCLQMRFGCPPFPRSYRQTRQAARPRHARTKWSWNVQATAVTLVPAAAPELIEGLVRHFAAQHSEKYGDAPSQCARYPLAPPYPAEGECTRSRHPSA